MKKFSLFLVLGIFVVALFSSCAKQPTQAIDAAKAAIEAAKNAAVQAQAETKAVLDEAKALLEKAPMGKGTKADIMAMKADLAGLETSFAELQTAIDGADYFGASAKAATIKEKATVVSDQVKAAIEEDTGKR